MLELFLALNRLVWWFLQPLEGHPKEILHSPMTKSKMFCQHFFRNHKKKLIEAHFHSFSLTQFQKTFLPVSNEQNTNFFSTSNAHDLFGSHYKLAKKNNLLGFTEKNHGSLVQIFGLEKKSKIKKYCFLLSHQICLWFNIFG